MTRPLVAIVGRTNVGKSTLLNRLAGQRVAVVGGLAGITRDRVFAPASWQGRKLTLIDTGGWQIDGSTVLDEQVGRQVGLAVAEADVIIFVVDVRDGLTAADLEIADRLRPTGKPVVLAVNKVDSDKQAPGVFDFCALGIAEPIAISAYHGKGVSRLTDAVLDLLPPSLGEDEESEVPRLAIVGRPNVGKSTLANALLGYERAIVQESPGTTRDALDASLVWDGRQVVLVDTAGLRRRSRVGAPVEYYATLRSLQAIDRCDVGLLMIDAGEFVTGQDARIASYILDAGKGMLLLVNKWDSIADEFRRAFKWRLEDRLRFMSYVPILYISATLGQNISAVVPTALSVWEAGRKRLSAPDVDMVVKQALQDHPPARVGGRRLRVTRAYQDESRPAAFVLKVNDPGLVYPSYRRYLENRLRGQFGFTGFALSLTLSQASSRKRTQRKSER
jgi:GTP-binding protein